MIRRTFQTTSGAEIDISIQSNGVIVQYDVNRIGDDIALPSKDLIEVYVEQMLGRKVRLEPGTMSVCESFDILPEMPS